MQDRQDPPSAHFPTLATDSQRVLGLSRARRRRGKPSRAQHSRSLSSRSASRESSHRRTHKRQISRQLFSAEKSRKRRSRAWRHFRSRSAGRGASAGTLPR